MTNKKDKLAIHFDADKYSYLETRSKEICKEFTDFINNLNSMGMLQVEIDANFANDTIESRGSKIVEGYKKYLKPHVEQSNLFMRDVAKRCAEEREAELIEIIEKFVKHIQSKDSMLYGLIYAAVSPSIIYNKQEKKFDFDSDILKEICTVYIYGEVIEFYKRVKAIEKELNILSEDCNRLSNNGTFLFADQRNNGVINMTSDRKYEIDNSIFTCFQNE